MKVHTTEIELKFTRISCPHNHNFKTFKKKNHPINTTFCGRKNKQSKTKEGSNLFFFVFFLNQNRSFVLP